MKLGNAPILLLLAVGAVAGCSTNHHPQLPDDPGTYQSNYGEDLAKGGRKIVVANCASCHAIDDNSKSPDPAAPPMKTLLWRYNPDMLANDLIEGIRVGHNEMPLFDFNVIGADSLVAYLQSITPGYPKR